MEHFVKMIGSPTGIPGPARGGEKMGAAWRPWPGLAQAGLSGENKMDSRKAGIHFLSPLRDIFCFPGEKWVHIKRFTLFLLGKYTHSDIVCTIPRKGDLCGEDEHLDFWTVLFSHLLFCF